MGACHLEPADKKKLIGDVGEELVRTHGKQKYYKPAQVRRAATATNHAVDVHCWAYCVFTTPSDFATFHAASGEVCDYGAMRASVLEDLAPNGFSSVDLDLPWLDWPDIDLSAIFSWLECSP